MLKRLKKLGITETSNPDNLTEEQRSKCGTLAQFQGAVLLCSNSIPLVIAQTLGSCRDQLKRPCKIICKAGHPGSVRISMQLMTVLPCREAEHRWSCSPADAMCKALLNCFSTVQVCAAGHRPGDHHLEARHGCQ